MIARGIAAAVALLFAAPLLAGTATRTSGFDYEATTTFLTKEIVEPNNVANPGLCLVTAYVPDAFGNRASTTVRNCNGTPYGLGAYNEAATPTGDPVFPARTSTATYSAGSITIGLNTYTWNAGQFATSVTNAAGHTETRTYDPRFGAVATLTGPNNLTTSWTYDGFGRKTSETRPDGTVSNWFYERCVDLPAGTCSNLAVYRVRVTATGAPTTSTYYDSLNREVRTETQGFDGTLVQKDTQYDALGRVAKVSRPYYAGATPVFTEFAYDVIGRVIQQDEPATPGGRARTATIYNGLVTTVTASNAGAGTGLPGGVTQTRTTTKNSQFQVVQVQDAQGNIVSYTYDEFGNLKTTTDAAPAAVGDVVTMSYDLRGRKIQMIDPDMGTWVYAYNAASDLIRQTDAMGQVTTIVPDPLGRVTNRTEPDLVSNWTYDTCFMGVGKLCQASGSNGYSRTQSYDSSGRPATLSVTIDTTYNVTTTYDGAGRVDTVTYPATDVSVPAFAVQNVYNLYGHLLQIQRVDAGGSTVFWRANAKSASSLVTSELLNNSLLTQTRTYDPVDRLSSVVAGALHNLSYQYDALGNVTQRVDNIDAVTENFSYDTLNRLTLASGPTLVTRSFNYDALGNMTYKSDVGSYAYPGVGAARPHAASSVTGTVNGLVNPILSYDANGNLTQVNAVGGTPCPAPQVAGERCAAYTSFNMPLTLKGKDAAGNLTTYTYTYSPEHERVRLVTALATGTQTSIYLHPGGGDNLFYEKEIKPDGSLEHKHYVNAGAQLVGVYVMKSVYASGDGPQMRYYHRDSLGSIMAISNESGAPIERLAYEPFGKRRFPNATADPNNTLFGITTDRGFTAHEHLDELELIHMNGRVYDPVLARFMTPDPVVPYPYNLQSFNRYSYAYNNPLRFIDPSGFEDEESGGEGGEATGSEETSSVFFSFFSLIFGGAQAGPVQDPVTMPSWVCGPNYMYTGKGEQTPDGGPSIFQNFWNGLTGQRGVVAEKFDPSFAGDTGTFVRNVGRTLPGVAYDVATGTMLVAGVATLDLPAEGIGLRMLAAREAAAVAEGGLAGSIRYVNVTRGTMNCVNCAIAADATLAGNAASALPGGATSIRVLETTFGGTFQPVSGPMQIGSILTQSGNGARGIVFGESLTAGEAGHVFNVINQGGKIQFLDAQVGGLGVNNFNNLQNFRFLLTRPGMP